MSVHAPHLHLDPEARGLDLDIGIAGSTLVGGCAMLFAPVMITIFIVCAATLAWLIWRLVKDAL
jgi:hypothetical protein